MRQLLIWFRPRLRAAERAAALEAAARREAAEYQAVVRRLQRDEAGPAEQSKPGGGFWISGSC